MTGHVVELATERKTVRRYSSRRIPMEDVIRALEAARQAPSGANRQPWKFLLVTDPEVKARLRRASERDEKELYENVCGEFREWLLDHGLSHEKPFLEEAPLLVAVLIEKVAPYARESVWVAIGYLLLALVEAGLGSMPYTPSNTEYPLSELNAPKGYGLEAILPIGYSDDENPKEPRKSIEEIVYVNRWGTKLDASFPRS